MKKLLEKIRQFLRDLFGGASSFDPLSNGYKLIFRDDFAHGIDWSKWDFREPWSGINLTYKGRVIWRKECVVKKTHGLALIADRDNPVANKCGLISSHNFMNFKYGFIEVSAKMPPQGFLYFPAIWMYDKRGWLPEIDIVELMGPDSKRATFTHHWLDAGGEHQSKGNGQALSFDLSEGLHQFAVEWTQGKLTWFIDRKKYYETTKNIPDVGLFLICNIQAGGDPAFSHVFETSEVPAEMIIKSIEVYQK